jgi:sugar lactone lactonase YvrE
MTREADPGVRVAVASPALLGESPMWHPQQQRLYYCDIPGRKLHRFDPLSQALEHWDFDTEVASIAPMQGGALLLAARDGLWSFDPASGARTLLAEPPYEPAKERFNDGKCDPQGRFWVGTIYEPRDPPLASLHCYSAGTLRRMADGITVSNGLAWSPNGRTMYWSDTKAHTIYALDFDPASGRPDGAAVDAEGCYWAAMFEGQRLLRLSPDGELLREVRLPVRCATMPCFGGPQLKTIYITTARENRPAAELAEQPFAGCVLALDVDVPGLPVNVFG